MPKHGEKDGIAFYVYGADHNPPHIHAFHGEHEVLLVIDDENRDGVSEEWKRLNPGARP